MRSQWALGRGGRLTKVARSGQLPGYRGQRASAADDWHLSVAAVAQPPDLSDSTQSEAFLHAIWAHQPRAAVYAGSQTPR